MSKFALIGHPLGHSMSPLIHEKLFALSGMTDAEYSLLDIDPADLPQKRELLGSLGGLNVTIPHKQAVIPLLDGLGESAQRYNSVNCIKNDGGRLTGYNTDCDGFLRSLEAAGSGLHGRVLQIGCGGVGRMIAIEAVRHGAELTVAVRNGSESKVQPVFDYAKENNIDAKITVVHPEDITGSYDVLVNASPVGMFPHNDDCPVSEDVIANCGFVFDVIYNPERTKIMQIAEKYGIKTCGGMAMLVWQAAVAHEIWNGASYKDDDIAALIADMHRLMEGK